MSNAVDLYWCSSNIFTTNQWDVLKKDTISQIIFKTLDCNDRSVMDKKVVMMRSQATWI